MKIAAKQTGDFLKSPSQVLGTLVYGPDDGLVLRHSRQIVKSILGEPYAPMSLIEISENALKEDGAKLADECGAMSLMGGTRLVWLRNIGEKYVELIEPVIPLLGPECYLLASAGECGPRHKMRALFEQHKQLASLACYRAEGRNLTNLIRDIMTAHGQQIDGSALQFLSNELGNDAMITESELNKLSLYAHGKGSVSLDDAKDAIIHNDEHKIDPLCMYFVDGRQADFDKLWQHLMRDGEQPIVLIRSLARYVSRLLGLKLAMHSEAMSVAEAINSARPPIFWTQKDSMTRQLGRLSARALVYNLHILNQAECGFKLHGAVGSISPHRMLLEHMNRGKRAA